MSCGAKRGRGSRGRVWGALKGLGWVVARQPQIARVLRLQHAQDGQQERAPGDRHDVGRGLARAVGAARVAVEVAPLQARREVGAAQLDVVARLAGEPLPRKLELAAQGQGARLMGRWRARA